MQRFVFAALLVTGCDTSAAEPSLEASLSAPPAHTACTASAYDGQTWTELGKFQSPPEPVVSNGELMNNAEFVVGDVRFSADGNPEEGLMYFGWIYDGATGAAAEMQRARSPELKMTLHAGDRAYALSCAMVAQ